MYIYKYTYKWSHLHDAFVQFNIKVDNNLVRDYFVISALGSLIRTFSVQITKMM